MSCFESCLAKTSAKRGFSAAVMTMFLSAGNAFAGGDVRVKVSGIGSLGGTIRASLDGSEMAFKNDAPTTQTNETLVTSSEIELLFHNVPPGVYAVKVIHDENDDKKLNQNLLSFLS